MIFKTFTIEITGSVAFATYEIYAFTEEEAVSMAINRFIQKRISTNSDQTILSMSVSSSQKIHGL